MKIKVNPHTLEIQKDLVNEREIDITKCEFEFSEEITQEYVKEAYFTFEGTSYKEIITNNQCNIPNEVLAKKGQIEIGVVAYLVESEEEIKRYNPSPAYFNTMYGSLKDNAENSEPITPSEMEQFEQALQDGINQIANIDINAEQTETGGIVEVTNKDGETTTITLTNGVDGEPGPRGEKGDTGSQGPRGETGPAGQNGRDGADGKDAKINGVNTLTIEAGSNINIEQEGSTMTISATGGSGGTSDYSDLSNKPKINNVELSGNKTTSDLGIDIPDVSNFITKDVNNLTNYTKTSDLSTVATSGSYNDLSNKPTIPTTTNELTNNSGFITNAVNNLTYYYLKTETYSQSQINDLISAITTMSLKVVQTLPTEDISTTTIYLVPKQTAQTQDAYDEFIYVNNAWEHIGSTDIDLTNYVTTSDLNTALLTKQDLIDSTHKISADLINDSSSTNKFVTASDKTTWSGKQDALVSGTNIKTINNNSILGSGNLTIEGNLKFLDVSTYSVSNPLYFDSLEVGSYILYDSRQNYGGNSTITITFKGKTGSTGSATITTYEGAILNYFIDVDDITNTNKYFARCSFIGGTTTAPTLYYYSFRISNTSTGRIDYDPLNSVVLTYSNKSNIGNNYNSSAIQYLKNENGTLNWVEESHITPTMLYMGKINLYDSSAKALDLSNYPASTRIVLKNNDSTRSFYIKVGLNTAQVSLTTDNDESIINNIFYVDINSISGNTASLAVVWASTYQWCPIVTNTVMINFTNNGGTVGTITRNMQGYALFQLEEDSNGDLSTTTLQEFVAIRTATFSKTRAPQRPAIHYFDKDKNSCLLSFTSQISGSQQVYEGVMTTKQPNTNGYYETYKVRLELNYSGTTYSNHTLTKTKIGYVLDGEVEEKDMVVTYSNDTTETVKLVVYR